MPTAPARPADDTAAVRSIRDDVQALLRAQSLALWQAWSAGAPVDSAPFTALKAKLLRDDVSMALAAARKDAATQSLTPERQRALELLHRFVEGERLGTELASIETAATAARSRARVKRADVELPFDELESRLAAEPNAAERAAWDLAAAGTLPSFETFERTRRERLRARIPATQLAGWRDSTPDAARALARRTLDATDAPYLARLDRLSRAETGLAPEKLRRADLPRLLRPPRLENAFGARSALEAVRSTFSGIGLPLAERSGLTFDERPEPKRAHRPAAFPIEPPLDVRLSYKPAAGEDHLRALLHETAVAVAATLTRAEPRELRTLGTAPAALAAAYLFEELVADPVWLSTVAKLPDTDAKRIAEHARFRRLFVARRLAASVLHALDTSPDEAASFRPLAARASGIAWTTEEARRWALETDPLLVDLDHLRAHVLASQLARELRVTAGPAWWTASAAGQRLAALWNDGSGATFDALARALGTDAPDPAALAADVER